MKYLIAGLGNPGREYENTRHNIGFKIIDKLANRFDVKFEDDNLAWVTEFKWKGRIFVLVKPTTYMNLSGKAVRYWLQKKSIPTENLLVVLDDLAIDFGKLRLRAKGSDGGHNGLRSIDQLLGGNHYARLRCGIGNNFYKSQQVDYVLGNWNREEEDALPEFIDRAAECVLSFGTIGLNNTMNTFNTK
ncbi:MAG TPA: aminoacyl-tRNA hydrolase [Saprospiraceae bacterium]|nr:aminoacyl-tRNA hydrolase [Saprospiraceae bacterium]MCC6688767.1 aminoacyl-tRNA hydrolase [Saprospiraceae bacterium]HMV23824.1 aminoacyl-tRNA hydrolase [Saprospiraceae bacterium]HMW75435.1 aminoacyl-tRNA hydrolase [Saprospiraceae bacterium]HMX83258.1 aminoacyl-tRNA hydrolase [Saprospiraceae bacterium]